MDDITRMYFELVGDKYCPQLNILIKSMMNRGYTLEECLDLTQFQNSYEKLFLELPKSLETLEFYLWLLPKVSLETVVESLSVYRCKNEKTITFTKIRCEHECECGYKCECVRKCKCVADIWLKLLRQKSREKHEFSSLVMGHMSYYLRKSNYGMLDILHELGMDFTGAFPHLNGLDRETNGVSHKIRYLLEHGADPNIPFIRAGKHHSMLHHYVGNIEVVRLLLDHGANLHRVFRRETPLAKVMRKGMMGTRCGWGKTTEDYLEVARELMSAPAINLTPEANCGSLLPYCMWPEFWPRLLAAGNNINHVSTSIHCCTLLQNLILCRAPFDVFEECLTLEPDLETISTGETYNATALWYACNIKKLDAIEVLLLRGANPDFACGYPRKTARELLEGHPRYNELFNHRVKRAE